MYIRRCGAALSYTQVVSKRLLPPDQQDLVFGMADHMLALLKIVTRCARTEMLPPPLLLPLPLKKGLGSGWLKLFFKWPFKR